MLQWPAWRGETLYILVSVQVSIAFTVLDGALSVRMTKKAKERRKGKKGICPGTEAAKQEHCATTRCDYQSKILQSCVKQKGGSVCQDDLDRTGIGSPQDTPCGAPTMLTAGTAKAELGLVRQGQGRSLGK